MLGKLLKYDLRASFKYWCILAVITVGCSFGGGIGNVINNNPSLYEHALLILFASTLVLIDGFCTVAFILMSFIFIMMQFYRNLFTDEGYLTFTLPVKRHQILNSKIISSILLLTATAIICIFCQITESGMLILSKLNDEVYVKMLIASLEMARETTTAADIALQLQLIVLAVISVILLVISAYFFITFGSVVAKKHKLLSVVVIVYVVCGVLSILIPFLFMCVVLGLMCGEFIIPVWFSTWILVILVGIINVIFAGLCFFMYTMELYLIGKKLNLA